MAKPPDENDRLRAGKLNPDAFADTEPVKPPLRVVAPGERPSSEPNDVTAERALLGALLWSGANAPGELRAKMVGDLLPSGDSFYSRKLGDIYDAICSIDEKAEHDPVAVHAALVSRGHQKSSGGLDELLALKEETSTLSEKQIRVYAHSIRDAWARRQFIARSREIAVMSGSGRTKTEEIIAKIQSMAGELVAVASMTSSVVEVNDSAASLITKLMGGKNTAIPTGFRDLDSILNGGLRPREVSVTAARTNVGKSQLAANIADNMVSRDPTLGVLYISLEMPHESFTARILAGHAGIPLSDLRKFELTPTQWSRLQDAAQTLMPKPLFFADSPSQTLANVYASAVDCQRRLNRQGKRLGMVVVDHIGLIKPSSEALKKSNREQQVAETSRGLRLIANDLNCHVHGIAQLGRAAEQKNGVEIMPRLHQIRESDSIGQDADLIFILHRERDAKTGLFSKEKPPALALAKGRMDDAGIILLNYDGARARFSNWDGPGFPEVYES